MCTPPVEAGPSDNKFFSLQRLGSAALLAPFVVAGLTLSGCTAEGAYPGLSVNCKGSSTNRAVAITIKNALQGARNNTLAISDGQASVSIDIGYKYTSNELAVNGHPMDDSSAGTTLAELPTATLVSGLPSRPKSEPGTFLWQDGSQAMTLFCNTNNPR